MAVLTPAGRYLAGWATASVILAMALVALTVTVDPWYVWGSPLRNGLNALKPAAIGRGALAKTHLLPRACPHTLLLGNSRVEVGIDPASDAWPDRMRPVFNAGAAGERPSYSLRILRLAAQHCAPRLVVLAVDFPDFLQQPSAPATTDLVGDPWHKPVLETLEAALSLAAITDSIKTLALQRDPDAPTLTAQGHNPQSEYRAMTARSGYHPLFAQKLSIYRGVLRTRPPAVLTRADSEPMRVLVATIAQARSAGVPVVLMLPPYHASYLDLIDATGRADEFGAWKVAVAAEANMAGVTLLDFSQRHFFTTEAIPARGDRRTTPRYYWESGHFKTTLGDEIIRRLAGENDGFGVELASGAFGQTRFK